MPNSLAGLSDYRVLISVSLSGWELPKNLRYASSAFIFTISCHPLVGHVRLSTIS